MLKRVGSFAAAALLAAGPAAAQDARAVLQAAAETMGVDGMTSIRYSGSGWVGATGQNYAPAEDWPRFELAEYTRTIDFETNSSTEEMVVRQGDYPARGGGGAPIAQLIPDKPIRWIVTTHHHWDHLGGMRAYVHEGATVVTHDGNFAYYQEILRARPWRWSRTASRSSRRRSGRRATSSRRCGRSTSSATPRAWSSCTTWVSAAP